MTKEREVDICIVGSGAGGAVAAYALGTAGFSVTVLEAGPRYSTSHYQMNKKKWEKDSYPFVNQTETKQKNLYTYSTPEKLDPAYAHLRSRTKVSGFNNSDRRRPPSISRVKGVGGST